MRIKQFNTKEITVTITDDDGAAVNLTDYDVEFTAVGPATITKTEGDGITISAPATGVLTVALDENDTAVCGNYKYDVEIDNGTNRKVAASGEFLVVKNVKTS